MSEHDIKWQQRFSNYKKALIQLNDAVSLAAERGLTKLEQQGLIQAFEYTHELAWNTLKDFLELREVKNIYGSKDTTRESFSLGLINDGEIWMDMIKSRNQTSHTYNEEVAEEIAAAIVEKYIIEFENLKTKLEELIRE